MTCKILSVRTVSPSVPAIGVIVIVVCSIFSSSAPSFSLFSGIFSRAVVKNFSTSEKFFNSDMAGFISLSLHFVPFDLWSCGGATVGSVWNCLRTVFAQFCDDFCKRAKIFFCRKILFVRIPFCPHTIYNQSDAVITSPLISSLTISPFKVRLVHAVRLIGSSAHL